MKCLAVPPYAMALEMSLILNLCFKINVWNVYATCPILSKFGFDLLVIYMSHKLIYLYTLIYLHRLALFPKASEDFSG